MISKNPDPKEQVPELRAPKKPSKVEVQKGDSDHLRGRIGPTLHDPEQPRFLDQDLNLLKFHGLYQQYGRDARARERQGKSERTYSCMVRVRVPGGVVTADQWLTLDTLAGQLGHGSIRLTTRQTMQFHGVLKGDVGTLIREINQTLLTTLAACGDVMRNVMCCPAIEPGPARADIHRTALAIADGLAPRTRAYHDIWLDGEKLEPAETSPVEDDFAIEPVYGRTYLPRKFKLGLTLPDDNCIDVYTQDLGFIAVLGPDGGVHAYNVLVGGGLGMTFRKPDTFARLGSLIGSVAPEHVVDVVRTVIEIFRDHGDRSDRRHARLKYVIEDQGLEWFAGELNRRLGFDLEVPVDQPRVEHHDHLGWTDQGDGSFTYGLFVENGRLSDDHRRRQGVRAVVEELRSGVRITPHQNLLFTGVRAHQRERLLEILHGHGFQALERISSLRRHAMACPALPTCSLALSDAERALPTVVDELEPLLEELGLDKTDIGIRMTGCPNGCARPYTADLGFVGRGPRSYGIYAGGGLAGDRLADLLADNVAQDDIVDLLRPVLRRYRDQRRAGESFGDFWHRASGRDTPRTLLTGSPVTYDATLEGAVIDRAQRNGAAS